MPVEYTNRKGVTYYLCRSVSKADELISLGLYRCCVSSWLLVRGSWAAGAR